MEAFRPHHRAWPIVSDAFEASKRKYYDTVNYPDRYTEAEIAYIKGHWHAMCEMRNQLAPYLQFKG
jgi:hypothetical protein